jgi:transposase InsO family protein
MLSSAGMLAAVLVVFGSIMTISGGNGGVRYALLPTWALLGIGYSAVMTPSGRRDQKKESAIAFLKEAVTYYRGLGMKVTGIMTDNGSCYRAKAFARACRKLGLKHIFTRPYRPQTNGKAERFIQTVLRDLRSRL